MDRDAEIVEYLKNRGFSSSEELASATGVSAITIRRDLARLEAAGKLRRVHGGAILLDINTSPHIQERLNRRTAEKQRIAAAAAGLVVPGETLFLDAGSTCYYLASALPENKNLVVATHSLDNLNALKSKSGIRIISLGGEYEAALNAFSGPITEMQMESLRVDKAFLGSAGLDPQLGCVNDVATQTRIKVSIATRAKEICILADADKFNVRPFCGTLPLERIDRIITDASVSDVVIKAFKKAQVSLYVAK